MEFPVHAMGDDVDHPLLIESVIVSPLGLLMAVSSNKGVAPNDWGGGFQVGIAEKTAENLVVDPYVTYIHKRTLRKIKWRLRLLSTIPDASKLRRYLPKHSHPTSARDDSKLDRCISRTKWIW